MPRTKNKLPPPMTDEDVGDGEAYAVTDAEGVTVFDDVFDSNDPLRADELKRELELQERIARQKAAKNRIILDLRADRVRKQKEKKNELLIGNPQEEGPFIVALCNYDRIAKVLDKYDGDGYDIIAPPVLDGMMRYTLMFKKRAE